jgi:putative membrane protein
VLASGLVGFTIWAVVTAGTGFLAVGADALRVLWLLPALVALHLTQLLLSAWGWRRLLPQTLRLSYVYRLRIIREGIDSLLPVAQIGGEIVGARLLAQRGIGLGRPTLAQAAASVVVDVTLEFLTQLAFLLAGIAAMVASSPQGGWQAWLSAALVTAAAAAGLLAAQRFGVLRLLEALARQIAARWPAAGALVGMDAEAAAIYRRRGPVAQASVLHLLAWMLGTLESWAILHAIGTEITPLQALIVESLGMAARSAGFAVPGALVVQETGFALAAAAVGLPEAVGLSLSLVKRVREVLVGLVGLALWWGERRRSASTKIDQH